MNIERQSSQELDPVILDQRYTTATVSLHSCAGQHTVRQAASVGLSDSPPH